MSTLKSLTNAILGLMINPFPKPKVQNDKWKTPTVKMYRPHGKMTNGICQNSQTKKSIIK